MLSKFFSTSNEINENTVMGVIFAAVTITGFILKYDLASLGIISGMTMGFFGIGAVKK